MVRLAFAVILCLHGLLHLRAALPQLTQPGSRPRGLLWLGSALLVLATAALLPLAPRWWWAAGALALLASQALIFSAWRDAKFGTIPNVLLLLGVAYGFAAHGPWSLPAEFDRDLAFASKASPGALLTEADLSPLPEPVQRYVRASGRVGQPRISSFRATWVGRIRASAEEPWMAFTAQQLNTFDPPRRFFLMDAVMKGLPVDVLHAFDEAGASMRVRLLSVKTVAELRGPATTRTETVTLFNDLCILAPSELVRPSITWERLDAHSARAHYTQGVNTISATLTFNDADELTDFVSDDRSQNPMSDPPTRWSTPLRDYGRLGPARVARFGEAVWLPASGAWSYGEFTLQSLAYDSGS